MPASFRRALQGEGEGRVVLTLLDQCLAGYPPREWQRLEERLRALPAFSRPARALTRMLTSRASDCDIDVQGRILLPAALREAAQLGQEAVIVGVLDRFEIWSPDAWTTFVQESERLLEDASFDVQWPLPPPPATPPTSNPVTSRPGRPQGKPNR